VRRLLQADLLERRQQLRIGVRPGIDLGDHGIVQTHARAFEGQPLAQLVDQQLGRAAQHLIEAGLQHTLDRTRDGDGADAFGLGYVEFARRRQRRFIAGHVGRKDLGRLQHELGVLRRHLCAGIIGT
jgi:hypothetical protein